MVEDPNCSADEHIPKIVAGSAALSATSSNADYHADTSHISASGLKLLAKSPAHYWAKYLDPERQPDAPKRNMIRGSMIHGMLFEPQLWERQYVQLPEGLDRRTKEGKALWQEIQATGKEPISAQEWRDGLGCITSILRHPRSMELFQLQGAAEQTLTWVDADTGVRCKARPDFMVPPGVSEKYPDGVIVDLKSTQDARPEQFRRTAWNLAYHIQAAHYINGFEAVYGKIPAFYFCAGEPKNPYPVSYIRAGESFVMTGMGEVSDLLEVYASCLATDTWPGYPEEDSVLEPPAWAMESEVLEVSYAE